MVLAKHLREQGLELKIAPYSGMKVPMAWNLSSKILENLSVTVKARRSIAFLLKWELNLTWREPASGSITIAVLHKDNQSPCAITEQIVIEQTQVKQLISTSDVLLSGDELEFRIYNDTNSMMSYKGQGQINDSQSYIFTSREPEYSPADGAGTQQIFTQPSGRN